MIEIADRDNIYTAHPYCVRMPMWVGDGAQTKHIIEWCHERFGPRASTPYRSDEDRKAAWLMGIITMRFRTYEDAFEFHMRWSGQ